MGRATDPRGPVGRDPSIARIYSGCSDGTSVKSRPCRGLASCLTRPVARLAGLGPILVAPGRPRRDRAGSAASRRPEPISIVPDPARGRQAIEAAMATWKAGQPTGIVEPTSPRVQVVDTHRKPGQRLVGFEILAESADARVRTFSVRLPLAEPEERPVVRFLVVGIDPVLVFRQEDYELLMHWEHRMDPEPERGDDAARHPRRGDVRIGRCRRGRPRLAVAGLGLPGRAGPPAVPGRAGGGVPDRRAVGRAPDLLGPLDLAGGPRRRRWGRSRPTPNTSARWTPASSPPGPASARSATWPWSAGRRGTWGRCPSGVVARVQLSPDRVLLAGIRSEPVGLSPAGQGDPRGRPGRAGRGPGHDPAEVGAERGLLARARAGGRGRPRPARRLAPGRRAGPFRRAEPGGSSRLVVEVADPPPALRSARFASVAVRSPVADREPFRSMPRGDPPLRPGEPRSFHACPDHPEVIRVEPGRCPKDEKPLDRVDLARNQRLGWWCPMHPKVVADRAGSRVRRVRRDGAGRPGSSRTARRARSSPSPSRP